MYPRSLGINWKDPGMFRERVPPPLPFRTLSPGRFPQHVFSEQLDTPPTTPSPKQQSTVPAEGALRSQHYISWHSIACPQQHTYLVKIGKTVRVLTQTLVLSPESVTSSYFPELLQVNDIQCTGQRRPICYNHALWQECASTREWDRSLGKHSGFLFER